MFDLFELFHSVWQTVEFVSLWSGISVGAVVGLGALFYFVPIARKIAIQLIILVVVAWSCLMHGHIEGRADEDARLQILSTTDDQNAATQAAADDKARAADIEAKAKAQHETDLAEIARLGTGCTFDPGIDGVQHATGIDANPVSHQTKPSSHAKPPRKAAASPKAGQGLHLPLVWRHGVPRKEHGGNAPPDGQ